MTLPVQLTDIVLGETHTIETLDGNIEIKIPAGTQFGEVLRVKGKGVPSARGRGRGDLLVSLEVDVPSKLSKNAKKLFSDLRDNEGV